MNLIPDEEFILIIKNNETYTDVLKEIGLSTRGGSSLKILKKRIENMGLSTKHFKPKYVKAIESNTMRNEDIFIKDSTYLSNSALKRKIIKYEMIPYKCSKCGNIGKWNGQPLMLQIDHINGINNDNRLENLRFLCPNCHSQTNTYAGKNRKRDKKKFMCKDCGKEISRGATRCMKCAKINSRKVKRPTKEELENMILNSNFVQIGKIYGVSDNAIRKWCKGYNINLKTKG